MVKLKHAFRLLHIALKDEVEEISVCYKVRSIIIGTRDKDEQKDCMK
jgi:hypothetical protein